MNTIIRELELVHIIGLDRGNQQWRQKALCAGHPQPDAWFAPPRFAAHHQALALCQRCPVRRECLEDAVECRVTEGIRGGLTSEEIGKRITFRQDRPDFARIRAVLLGQRIPLTDPEKRVTVRVAQMVGIPWEVWSPALGIGYKAALKRRRHADRELAIIPEHERGEESALADELRQMIADSMAVAA
ncbi:WhiB family transcriptional regulator [Kitasatospora sp. NPDC057015]|uniref:WhiB family transcriptional regulator n=1 Tax=Kitasatospora sp. NPDC057015 TaxID=3346001 RepID=UPI00363ADB31